MVDVNQHGVTHDLEEFTSDITAIGFRRGEEYINSLWDPFYVFSIGKCNKTHKIIAAADTRFYLSDEFECLYLR